MNSDDTATQPTVHTIETVGIVGSGIMGAGLVEVAARSGRTVILRSRTQATRRRCDREGGIRPGASGRQGSPRVRRTRRHSRPDLRHRRTRRLRPLRPRDRVGDRGPRHQEGGVRRARHRGRARRHPRHEHLHASRRRTGDGDGSPGPCVRHPLLQPGADDEAGRGDPSADGLRRHDRHRARLRHLVRQGRGRGRRPRRASSSTHCCSRT